MQSVEEWSNGSFAYGVGIDGEDVFVERGVNSNDIPHLMVDLQFEWVHGSIKMDTVQVLHNQHLRVSLPTITRFRAFGRFANLYDNHVSGYL
jgi:hypothetical protein